MARVVDVAEVRLWGRMVGAVAWNDENDLATFEYDRSFLSSGIEVAPLTMLLRTGQFRFPELDRATYRGLPGLLADSLPDKFGNLLIDTWLARQGRGRRSFNPVQQLCYIGTRGMGALEYHPAVAGRDRSAPMRVDELADLAGEILSKRQDLTVALDDDGLAELLLVGTSAGGARAKAIVAWNPETNEARSGQAQAPEGFEYWIVKFDRVGSSDRGFRDSRGYGRIEYAYHLMARDAGIEMTPAHLHNDRAGRSHFMTKRFDRTDRGDRIHMQTLSGLAHLDYNQAGIHSYEDALAVTLRLCGAADVERLYRRMVFNVVARNQDDHSKNISFLMDRSGCWSLSPAYDVTWSFNPEGEWTARHQMTVNGKRTDFTRLDLEIVAGTFGVRRSRDIVAEVVDTVSNWVTFADEAEVAPTYRDHITGTLRLTLE